jgi:hypothetical protein
MINAARDGNNRIKLPSQANSQLDDSIPVDYCSRAHSREPLGEPMDERAIASHAPAIQCIARGGRYLRRLYPPPLATAKRLADRDRSDGSSL